MDKVNPTLYTPCDCLTCAEYRRDCLSYGLDCLTYGRDWLTYGRDWLQCYVAGPRVRPLDCGPGHGHGARLGLPLLPCPHRSVVELTAFPEFHLKAKAIICP